MIVTPDVWGSKINGNPVHPVFLFMEAAYGTEISQLELQTVVYKYMNDHVQITWQETDGQ